MPTECSEHIPSPNPRSSSCCRCGRPIPDQAPSEPAPIAARDETYEQAFIHEASKTAETRHGLPVTGFPRNVLERLTEGQRLYGNAYMSQNREKRAQEIREEAQDSAAYALLDAQQRMITELDDDAGWHLFEIAVHAAAIDSHARALARND